MSKRSMAYDSFDMEWQQEIAGWCEYPQDMENKIN